VGVADAEPLGERLDVLVTAGGGKRSHVQGVSDILASAADGTSPHHFAAVVAERRNADERSDLLAIELSQFGKIGQERGRSDLSDAWNGSHEIDLVLPVVVLANDLFDLLLDAGDLFFQGIEHGLDAFLGGLRGSLLETIGLGGSQVDELSTALDELLQFGLGAVGQREATRLDDFPEACEDSRIDGIGLGEDAERFGEISGLAWIDESHQMACLEQFPDDQAFETTRGFEHDDASPRRRQLLEDFQDAWAVILDRTGFGVGPESELERSFSNIDTDIRKFVHGNVPSLQIRARRVGRDFTAQAAVRAKTKRSTTIMLGFGM